MKNINSMGKSRLSQITVNKVFLRFKVAEKGEKRKEKKRKLHTV
jgi:hypothetical protein